MHLSIRHAVLGLSVLVALCATSACSKPQPPPTDQPPEPQAQHTQLRDAIQQPLDKAKSVEKALQDAADQQRAEIDDNTGG